MILNEPIFINILLGEPTKLFSNSRRLKRLETLALDVISFVQLSIKRTIMMTVSCRLSLYFDEDKDKMNKKRL